MKPRDFDIGIFNLKDGLHEYSFPVTPEFFEHFSESEEDSTEEQENGSGQVNIVLEKNARFIKTTCNLVISLELLCDRSLEAFEFELNIEEYLIFKYGEEEREVDDEVRIITKNTHYLNLARDIYEWIITRLPMKRLHPRFDDDELWDEENEAELVYASDDSGTAETSELDEEKTDPRWAMLKKLKDNS